jgi:DNA helicase HerA-like ATPase
MTSIQVAKNLQLPAEFTGRRTAVFGISGSGKSNTAAVIVEQSLAAGEQVVLIDPKGVASGRKELGVTRPPFSGGGEPEWS